MKGVWVSENLRKLIGVTVMAAIVVVGVVVTNDDDIDFTRNMALLEASPLLEGQGDLKFELLEARIAILDERIRTVEKFLTREELAELTEVARTLVADIRELSEASQELHSEMGETEQRFSETGQRLSEAYEFASNQINRLEAEEGWIQTLDLMCQQQLSAWARAATRAEAIWDRGGGVYEIPGFWACRYDNLNIPELEGLQLSERVGVCLPGGQPRDIEGQRSRGLGGFAPFFAESINRWVFQFNPYAPEGQHETYWFDAGCT